MEILMKQTREKAQQKFMKLDGKLRKTLKEKYGDCASDRVLESKYDQISIFKNQPI